MIYAYAKKILWVNLSTGKVAKKPLDEELTKKYLGGKGIGTWLLYNLLKPRIDPLSPENKLIFATGPATGTIVPHKGYIVCYKSPLTGIYGSSSSGGSFADELKQAGYDVLIIEGRAEKPVYLWIDDDRVQIKEAKHLWGKDTVETNDMIKEEIGDDEINVARIGPAGEKLVRIALIVNDYSRVAGRCGPGAVMGSKNLKAIALRGTGGVEVANIDELLEFVKELYGVVNDKMVSYQKWGTSASIDMANELGYFPIRYWYKNLFAGYKKIDANAIEEKIFLKSKACYSCAAYCGKLSEVKSGLYEGASAELDYETLWSLGGLCENENLESIVKANEICDRLGIDTISAGNIVAFAMKCYEQGVIGNKETEAIELVWGNHEAIVDMVEKIALREGLGDVLAEGVRRAAERLGKGAEKFVVHIKGLEPPAFDPRGLEGTAVAFAVTDRGACHLSNSFYTWEVRGLLGLYDYRREHAAALLKDLDERFAVCDSLILCRFVSRDIFPWNTLEKLLPMLTGIKIGEDELKRVGERIHILTRAFNVREGISRKDDVWPKRFFKEPISDGPMKGMILKKNAFNKMLKDYYELRGWDKNGIPTSERLTELGLKDSIPEIESIRKKIGGKNA